MYCKNCGNEMLDKADICLNCGVMRGTGISYCANCGGRLEVGQNYCMKCGASKNFGAQKPANDDPFAGSIGGQDKTVLIILALLIGGLGIHNFMLGESRKAGLKIILSICAGIGYLLALYDVYKMLTNKYIVEPDKWI